MNTTIEKPEYIVIPFCSVLSRVIQIFPDLIDKPKSLNRLAGDLPVYVQKALQMPPYSITSEHLEFYKTNLIPKAISRLNKEKEREGWEIEIKKYEEEIKRLECCAQTPRRTYRFVGEIAVKRTEVPNTIIFNRKDQQEWRAEEFKKLRDVDRLIVSNEWARLNNDSIAIVVEDSDLTYCLQNPYSLAIPYIKEVKVGLFDIIKLYLN